MSRSARNAVTPSPFDLLVLHQRPIRSQTRRSGRLAGAGLSWLLAVPLVIGCGPLEPAEREDDTIDRIEQPAYASTTRIWPKTSLSVCFTFTGKGDLKALVRDTIKASYEQVSGLRFTGWGECPSADLPTGSASEADIKIKHATDSIWSYLGTDSAKIYPSMQLNFDQNNWLGVVNSALHEFSHAVGLYDEFERPDHPNPANTNSQPDGKIFGDYDFYSASVISYNGYAGRMLSPTDVVFLRYYYGTSEAYSAQNTFWKTFDYSAVNTNNAQLPAATKTVDVYLNAGDTLMVGTCGLPFGLADDDTFLRLAHGLTPLVANDNACGGTASFFTYEAPTSGTRTIRAGCSGNTSCKGIVTYTVGRPDLVVTSLSHNPPAPSNLSTITFTAVVKNQGGVSSPPSSLRMRIGGETYGVLLPVGALAPGKSATVQRTLTLTPQSYIYRATADALGAMTELSETNNEATSTMQVSLVQPDLVVSSLDSLPLDPLPGEDIKITAVVKNVGAAPAPASTLFILVTTNADPTSRTKSISIPALAPGQTSAPQIFSFTSSSTPAMYWYSATADLGGTVTESNETNNGRSGQTGTY